MAKEIKITKKAARRGDDGYKIVSVRMRDEMIARLDALSSENQPFPQRIDQFVTGCRAGHRSNRN